MLRIDCKLCKVYQRICQIQNSKMFSQCSFRAQSQKEHTNAVSSQESETQTYNIVLNALAKFQSVKRISSRPVFKGNCSTCRYMS